ncbi:hypothetical protein [Streptomyces sp. HUAS ZL42]|uniref:hypothetical protein n=1 Tax=Streptomyces sp. HUAS ZL42 TaxID=3231715 RepID=UPI00345E817F
MAALPCVACCARPMLITAGVIGAGAGAVVRRLPALAVVLAVFTAGTWWLGRRPRSCSCAPKAAGANGCDCRTSGDSVQITTTGRR